MSNKTIFVLLIISVLVSANVFPAMAQNNANLRHLTVNMEIAPYHVDAKNSIQSIGYVNLVNKAGIAIKAPQDVTIKLESDDPEIASVPSEVMILEGDNFAKFDVTIGNEDGDTTISSLFNGIIDYADISVGVSESSLPDDVEIKINLL